MFNFFKNKEYISCQCLEYGIHFDSTGLYHCANYFHNNLNNVPIVPLVNHKYDIKKFLEIKKQQKKYIKNGFKLPCSQNCFEREKGVWKNKIVFKQIAISANSACNCDCIYCATHPKKEYCNAFPDILVYDIITDLFSKGLIDKHCRVQFGGGEPTLHCEFEKLLRLFTKNLDTKILIHSSGIKYSEAIAELIQLSRAELVISVDSSSKEQYFKIKNTDKWDVVWSNIEKYCSFQKNSKEPNQVAPKYIIIPDVNDNESDIDTFLNKVKASGCNMIKIDIENNWYKRNINNKNAFIPIFKLFKFMESEAQKYKLDYFYNAVPNELIRIYPDLYR